MDGIITIEINERQAKILKFCETYYEKIEYIALHGGFSVKGGRTIIDYDDGSNISNVQLVLNFPNKRGGDNLKI